MAAGRGGVLVSYLFFDALGYHYFLRKQGYGVKLSFALYISLMGFYYSNITPGASGGQPMQIYYMNKKGVPIGIGTSGISMKFIANQLMTVLMASALWLWNAAFVDRQLAGARWVVVIGWLINFAAVPLILLVAFHRPLVQRIAAFSSGWDIACAWSRTRRSPRCAVNTTLDSYHASVLRLSRHPRQIAIQLGLSALSVLGLMSVVLFVYRAFGESGTPWHHLLTISFLLFLSASYTPLPGASGAQEGGFLLYYRGLFTQGTAGLALLVWRFMNYYLFLIIGAASRLSPSCAEAQRPAPPRAASPNSPARGVARGRTSDAACPPPFLMSVRKSAVGILRPAAAVIGQARIRHRDMRLTHPEGAALHAQGHRHRAHMHAHQRVAHVDGRVRLDELRHGGVFKAPVRRRARAAARLGHRHHVDLRQAQAVQQGLLHHQRAV